MFCQHTQVTQQCQHWTLSQQRDPASQWHDSGLWYQKFFPSAEGVEFIFSVILLLRFLTLQPSSRYTRRYSSSRGSPCNALNLMVRLNLNITRSNWHNLRSFKHAIRLECLLLTIMNLVREFWTARRCQRVCNEVTLANIVLHIFNLFAGEPISSHAKGYEAVVHFG